MTECEERGETYVPSPGFDEDGKLIERGENYVPSPAGTMTSSYGMGAGGARRRSGLLTSDPMNATNPDGYVKELHAKNQAIQGQLDHPDFGGTGSGTHKRAGFVMDQQAKSQLATVFNPLEAIEQINNQEDVDLYEA